MNEIYISVDIEAAGPIPGSYSMLSLGACVVGNTRRNFYIEFQPINNNFESKAIEIVGRSLDDFFKIGETSKTAMQKFSNWIQDVSQDIEPIFVGFNAPFDWSFVNWYFHEFAGNNPFGISGIDIKAYYMGMSGCSWSDTTMSKIPTKFKGKTAHTHNALQDAIGQAEIFELMRNSAR